MLLNSVTRWQNHVLYYKSSECFSSMVVNKEKDKVLLAETRVVSCCTEQRRYQSWQKIFLKFIRIAWSRYESTASLSRKHNVQSKNRCIWQKTEWNTPLNVWIIFSSLWNGQNAAIFYQVSFQYVWICYGTQPFVSAVAIYPDYLYPCIISYIYSMYFKNTKSTIERTEKWLKI